MRHKYPQQIDSFHYIPGHDQPVKFDRKYAKYCAVYRFCRKNHHPEPMAAQLLEARVKFDNNAARTIARHWYGSDTRLSDKCWNPAS